MLIINIIQKNAKNIEKGKKEIKNEISYTNITQKNVRDSLTLKDNCDIISQLYKEMGENRYEKNFIITSCHGTYDGNVYGMWPKR